MTRRFLYLAGLAGMLGTTLATAAPAPAPAMFTLRTNTPGAAFRVVRGEATVDDVPAGRRVRGAEHAEVTLLGELRLPPPKADRHLVRLVLHFQTSRDGPKLYNVVLHGNYTIAVDLAGNQMADSKSNTLDFSKAPMTLQEHTTLKLVINYPGAIDSHVDPGEFVLHSVSIDTPRTQKTLSMGSAHELAQAAPAHDRARATAQQAHLDKP